MGIDSGSETRSTPPTREEIISNLNHAAPFVSEDMKDPYFQALHPNIALIARLQLLAGHYREIAHGTQFDIERVKDSCRRIEDEEISPRYNLLPTVGAELETQSIDRAMKTIFQKAGISEVAHDPTFTNLAEYRTPPYRSALALDAALHSLSQLDTLPYILSRDELDRRRRHTSMHISAVPPYPVNPNTVTNLAPLDAVTLFDMMTFLAPVERLKHRKTLQSYRIKYTHITPATPGQGTNSVGYEVRPLAFVDYYSFDATKVFQDLSGCLFAHEVLSPNNIQVNPSDRPTLERLQRVWLDFKVEADRELVEFRARHGLAGDRSVDYQKEDIVRVLKEHPDEAPYFRSLLMKYTARVDEVLGPSLST